MIDTNGNSSPMKTSMSPIEAPIVPPASVYAKNPFGSPTPQPTAVKSTDVDDAKDECDHLELNPFDMYDFSEYFAKLDNELLSGLLNLTKKLKCSYSKFDQNSAKVLAARCDCD